MSARRTEPHQEKYYPPPTRSSNLTDNNMYEETKTTARDYNLARECEPPETQKEGEVTAEVLQLHELVMLLEKEFDTLSQRISPVLENVPLAGTEASTKPQRNSELATRISTANSSLVATIQRIKETRNRIAL